MVAARSLLCIHRDPAQLSLLEEKGFSLLTATHVSQGLRLLASKPVDAVILEYHLGLLDGAVVADEIKKVRPRLPIVMLAESLELPEGALKSVDALVTNCDGPRFLLEAIHTVLQAKDRQHCDTASAGQAEQRGEESMPSPAKPQILVVDDDQSVRESVSMSLMAAGYDVVAAEDGFRALSQLKKKLPELMLSDLDMPGMSGFELLSVVRRRFPQISTVAMSGAYVGGEVPFGVIADGFFAKGSQSKNLLRTIQQLLLTAQTRRSNHHRECSPAWIPRNGHDSKAMPYVVLTCEECLRAFPMNLTEGTTGEILEIPCRYCHSMNRYIIEPSNHCACEASA
ncbi:MAG TPA: response regulator [Dongiaceae bacterium]|nr:response regulator [Dongiaceae bacterium]